MVSRIQRWGNSQGLRLSLRLLEELKIEVGDEVEIQKRKGVIVITPVRRVRGGKTLKNVLKGLPKDSRMKELNWGEARGREEW